VTATQQQLPELVERALAIVGTRLSGGGGTGLYDSIHAQLVWISDTLAVSTPPDPARVDKLLLGVYAARELEMTDPELADLLFNVEYLFKRWSPRPPQADLALLITTRMKRAARPMAMVATVTFLSALFMGFLSFAAHPTIVGRVVLIAFALMGFGATGWLIVLVATGGRRAARLLDLVENHPQRVERIYAGHVRKVGIRSARMEALSVPESEHIGDRDRRWYVLVTRRDPMPFQRFFGLNFDSIPVGRDEVLPLLDWLRAKAPSATGPPGSSSPTGPTT
jgi:hypothetical protein